MAYFVILLFTLFYSSEAVLPNYIPALELSSMAENCDDLVGRNFCLGLGAAEILAFITNVHGFRLSLRQSKRILRVRVCRRKRLLSNFDNIIQVIK